MDNRQRLINMANGTRSGLWIEVLHTADGGTCYALHNTPNDPKMEAAADKIAVGMPYTWDAVRILVAKYLGSEDAIDTLDIYDDGRTATGDVTDADVVAALAKWIKV